MKVTQTYLLVQILLMSSVEAQLLQYHWSQHHRELRGQLKLISFLRYPTEKLLCFHSLKMMPLLTILELSFVEPCRCQGCLDQSTSELQSGYICWYESPQAVEKVAFWEALRWGWKAGIQRNCIVLSQLPLRRIAWYWGHMHAIWPALLLVFWPSSSLPNKAESTGLSLPVFIAWPPRLGFHGPGTGRARHFQAGLGWARA